MDYIAINAPAIASMAKTKNDMSSINDASRALIELRVPQINGSAYCVDLHKPEARKAGVAQQWLVLLTIWQDVPAFDTAEKVALRWAEAVTLITENGAPDAVYTTLSSY